MGDRETIDTTLEGLAENELETAQEAATGVPISNTVELTPRLVMDVLAALRAGKTLPEIKREVYKTGPAGQKWKLTREQIKAIADRRRYYYLRATGAIVE